MVKGKTELESVNVQIIEKKVKNKGDLYYVEGVTFRGY